MSENKPGETSTTPATAKALGAAKPTSTVKAAAAAPVAAKAPAKKPVAKKVAAPVTPATTAKVAPEKKAAPLPAAKIAKPAKAEKTAKPASKATKAEKLKKPKLVRDSFTMPEDEYAQIAAAKKRLLSQGIAAKKSEVLRAALALFAAQSDSVQAAAIGKLAIVKTGRPAK